MNHHSESTHLKVRESALEDVAERLERLERENRRCKWLAAAGVVGLSAMLLMGQAFPPSPRVEANEFVLKDPSGMVRASLTAQPEGPVTLSLNDR